MSCACIICDHIVQLVSILIEDVLVLLLFLFFLNWFTHILLQEIMRHRDAAQMAAIEAMQEATAAVSLLRCLRYNYPRNKEILAARVEIFLFLF